MANYIGKEPTPVPLSTADYQDGSITGVKLAPNAASTNLGFVPFNPTTGGTINGPTNFANNVGVSGTTTLEALIVNDPADFNDTFNADGAATFNSTVRLAADPTLPLQAATKQYVDTNFSLSTGLAGQTLPATGLTLTNASARLIEFTTVAEFAFITLPAANTLTVSNGKFVFHNDGGNPFGIYDSTGRLLGAVGPSTNVTVYLYDASTAAGSWGLVGADLRPFFINNAANLPLSGVALADTLASTDFASVVKLDTNRYVVVAKDATATNNLVYAHAINTATKPASVGPRVNLTPLSVGTSLVTTTPGFVYPVSSTALVVANGASTSSIVVLTVDWTTNPTSPTITGNTTSATTFAANPILSNSATSELQTIVPVATTTVSGVTYADTFVAVSAPSNAVCAYQVFKIDTGTGNTFRISAITNSVTLNGTGFAGAVDLRQITFDAGTGVGAVGCLRAVGTVAPYALTLDRVVIQKGGPGIAPTITSIASLVITGAALAATPNFGWCADYSSPNFGCVFYYANTTILPTFNGVTGLLPANTPASLGATTIGSTAGVALAFQRQVTGFASATGLIGNARGLLFDYWRNGSWRAYIMAAASTAFVKISNSGGVFTAQVADFAIPEGANTVLSSMAFVGTPSSRDLYFTPDAATNTPPSLAVLCTSTPTPAAGANGGAKIYKMVEETGNKIDLKDVYSPSTFVSRDSTPTLIGYQLLSTLNGFFMVPVGPATATTTTQLGFNIWAFYKLNPDGSIVYYGNWNLPLKVVNEISFNQQYSRQNTEIVTLSNAVTFSQAQGIHYREFVRIDTVFE
jgi:hypothetical protein